MKTTIKEQIKLNEEARQDLLETRKEYWKKGDRKNYNRITAELKNINLETRNLRELLTKGATNENIICQ